MGNTNQELDNIKENVIKSDKTYLRSNNFSLKEYFYKYTTKLITLILLIYTLLLNVILLATNKTGKMISFGLTFFVIFFAFFALCLYFIGEFFKYNIHKKVFSLLTDYIPFIATVLGFVFIFIGQLFGIAKISGDSMFPTLKNGQNIIIEKYNIKPQNGDIVVFCVRNEKGNKEFLIKRCWAVPNDTIIFTYDHIHRGYTISVMGKEVENPKKPEIPLITLKQINDLRKREDNNLKFTHSNNGQLRLTLKENEYFVIGDNFKNSKDSRSLGFIYDYEIAGRKKW